MIVHGGMSIDAEHNCVNPLSNGTGDFGVYFNGIERLIHIMYGK